MFTVRCNVGRLVETRAVALETVDEVTSFAAAFQRATVARARNVIVCADYRALKLLEPNVAEHLLAALRRENASIERSGILLSPLGATMVLQVERLVREARNPARRTFRVAKPMRDWLGETMTEAEKQRAAEFLAEVS